MNVTPSSLIDVTNAPPGAMSRCSTRQCIGAGNHQRPEYLKAFWTVVNWNKANELYAAAKAA